MRSILPYGEAVSQHKQMCRQMVQNYFNIVPTWTVMTSNRPSEDWGTLLGGESLHLRSELDLNGCVTEGYRHGLPA